MSNLIKRLRQHALVELKLKVPQNKKQNVVAIVYDKKGKIFSYGENSFTKMNSHQALIAKRVNEKDKVYVHAEVHALLRWRRFTDNIPYGIFVARLGKNGNLANSKPCPICMEVIRRFGVKKIDYT